MICVTTESKNTAIVNLSSQYGVIMTKVLLFHILLLENWEIKDPFMLLHRKLPRVALGRIPLLAFSVILRMPQTCPCCTHHPWEQELSHKSVELATARFSSCHSSLPICLILLDLLLSLQHPHWSRCAKTQAEITTSEHREGCKIKIQRLHIGLGKGKNEDVTLWIVTTMVILAIYRSIGSLVGIRNVPKKLLRFWSPWLLVLPSHQSYLSPGMGWSVMTCEFQDTEEFCWGLTWASFYLALCWFLDVSPGGTEQWLLCVGDSSYRLSRNCAVFYNLLKCGTRAGSPAGAKLALRAVCLRRFVRETWCGNSVLLQITMQERTTQKACGRKILNRKAQGWDSCGTAHAVTPVGS